MREANDIDGEDQDTGKVAPKCLQKTLSFEKLSKNNDEFSVDKLKRNRIDLF